MSFGSFDFTSLFAQLAAKTSQFGYRAVSLHFERCDVGLRVFQLTRLRAVPRLESPKFILQLLVFTVCRDESFLRALKFGEQSLISRVHLLRLFFQSQQILFQTFFRGREFGQ